jgi:hypothetical protein
LSRVCFKPFGLALGLWVPWGAVLLGDAEAAQFVFEVVAAAAAAGEPGCVDHAVVGQRRSWWPKGRYCGAEGVPHDRAGDLGVGGD